MHTIFKVLSITIYHRINLITVDQYISALAAPRSALKVRVPCPTRGIQNRTPEDPCFKINDLEDYRSFQSIFSNHPIIVLDADPYKYLRFKMLWTCFGMGRELFPAAFLCFFHKTNRGIPGLYDKCQPLQTGSWIASFPASAACRPATLSSLENGRGKMFVFEKVCR